MLLHATVDRVDPLNDVVERTLLTLPTTEEAQRVCEALNKEISMLGLKWDGYNIHYKVNTYYQKESE